MAHGHAAPPRHVSTREAALARQLVGGPVVPAGRDGHVTITGAAGAGTPFAEVEGADTIDGLTGLTYGHVPNYPLR